jgi:ABC-type nitrate/sulfonate/bicarbonate transport system substrate-binding protein
MIRIASNDHWHTDISAPIPQDVDAQLGWFADEFASDGFTLRPLQSGLANLDGDQTRHDLPGFFRQSSSILGLWDRSRGVATRLIGLSWTNEFQAILALPASGITRAAHLVGRRIGLPIQSRTDHIGPDIKRASALRGFAAALELDGHDLRGVEWIDTVDPERTTLTLEAAPYRPRGRHGYRAEVLALLRGEVDAIYVRGALGLETVRLIGARVVAEFGSHADPQVRVNNSALRTLSVDHSLIEKRPDLITRFLGRLVDAEAWVATHPREVLSYVARETGSSIDWVQAAHGEGAHGRLPTFLSDEAITALASFKDFLIEHEFLHADFDVRSWVDGRPLEAIDLLRLKAA